MNNSSGLAPGQYDFRFVKIELSSTLSGRPMYRTKLKLEGYTGYWAYDYFVDAPSAEWKWKDLGIEEFKETPIFLIGQAYLCQYVEEKWEGEARGMIRRYLAKKENR